MFRKLAVCRPGAVLMLCAVVLTACGGGGGGGSSAVPVASPSGVAAGSSAAATNAGAGSTGASPSPIPGSPTPPAAPGPASPTVNQRLGAPARVLLGLGAGNNLTDIQAQAIHPDIIDTYLVGVGSTSWLYWNSPTGQYLILTAQSVSAAGAIPMFTLYQMAQNGDGNLSGIHDSTFMSAYWSQTRLMFQLLGAYGKPALVNMEPDFWGYVWQQAPNHNPGQLAAVVNTQSECATLPNSAAGIAPCMLAMARQYAPKTLVGFPPSFWGNSGTTIAQEMALAGAQNADFIVAQTLDRDAGCFELASPPPECQNRTGPFYWDAANVATPNFLQAQQQISDYRAGLGGNQPILWWQTPMGVPSTIPGGTPGHYRDNRVDYMLKNAQQYGAIHTFAMVFSAGATGQTTITTDGGQFKSLSTLYLSSGGATVQ